MLVKLIYHEVEMFVHPSTI